MLFSRRFWTRLMSAQRRVKEASAACDACYERLKASRDVLTREAQRELLLEYQLSTAELVEALNTLRAFQANQKLPQELEPSPAHAGPRGRDQPA